jgi:hypothetical protein
VSKRKVLPLSNPSALKRDRIETDPVIVAAKAGLSAIPGRIENYFLKSAAIYLADDSRHWILEIVWDNVGHLGHRIRFQRGRWEGTDSDETEINKYAGAYHEIVVNKVLTEYYATDPAMLPRFEAVLKGLRV